MKATNIVTQCGTCNRQTAQQILFNKKIRKRIEADGNTFEQFAMMTVECNGCKTVSFVKRSYIADLEFEGKTGFIDENYPNPNEYYFEDFNFLHHDDQSLRSVRRN